MGKMKRKGNKNEGAGGRAVYTFGQTVTEDLRLIEEAPASEGGADAVKLLFLKG